MNLDFLCSAVSDGSLLCCCVYHVALLCWEQVKILVRLSELDFEISMLALSTLIRLPLDIISKCANILSKPTEPKVSSDTFHASLNLTATSDTLVSGASSR